MHENIRYHVCLTMTQLSFGLLRLFTDQKDSDEKFNWRAGLPAPDPLPSQVVEYLTSVLFPHFMKLFQDEEEKEVIEKVLECVRDIADEMGPAGI